MARENVVVVNAENFNEVTAAPGKLVIVDFWASWCMPCKAVAPVLDRLADEYPDALIIGKLNIDEQRELAIEHRVTGIPTLQFYKNGTMADVIVGSLPYQDLKDAVDRNMP